jgi:hypothetical protein
MADERQGRKIVTRTVTAETTFEDFESISIIDAGSDGFKIKGQDYKQWASQSIVVPTGIPYNAGVASGRYINSLTIEAPTTGSLNASVSIID